jgi:eukaryotic-like serine/threonine-protein kinase
MQNQDDQPGEIESQPNGTERAEPGQSLEKTQFFADDSSPTSTGSKSASSGAAKQKDSKKAEKIVGGYRLIKMLGEGGMGRVYQAADESGRMVAVKLLSPELSRSPEALERFKLEGVIASAISHPHCVFVHRADEDAGTPFIAMELMTGQTLKDIVARRGPLPFAEAIPLVLQCIDGLIEAHSRGMIHRDVKPANCYLDDQGNVKIGDFGLARSLVSDSELTRTGSFLGTPLYASPEQILGEKIDEQSDIYSLAATIYFLLAGKAPFESPHATQVIAKIVSADPPNFAEVGVQVPRKLEQVVLRGLARERSKRYLNFQVFRDDLVQAVAQRDRVATLPRRALAYVIDSFLVSIMMGLFAIIWLANGWEESEFRSYINLLGTLLQGVYLLALESLFGTTIGKRLLGLRVVDPELGTRPQFLSCLSRTVAFMLVMNAVELLASLFVTPTSNLGLYATLSWVGYFLGNAIVVLNWRQSKRTQLLHERFSKTQTWVPTQKATIGSIDLPEPRWSIKTQPVPVDWAIPSQLGRFEIIGQIPTTDGSQWLSAHDSTIERSVWIQLSPATCPPPSESREKCIRRTRMRFLETGIQDNWRWDAYVAPDGAPISLWFDYRSPMPWHVTQKVMLDAMDELQAGNSSDSPTSNAIARWWLTSTGKLTLSEAAVSTGAAPSESKTLFAELASLALPDRKRGGRSGNLVARAVKKSPVLSIAPLRATHMLQRLKLGTIFDKSWIRRELDRVANGPQSVTVAMRLVHAAILSIAGFVPWLILTLALMLPAIIAAVDEQKDARSFTTLAAILRDPGNHQELVQQLEASKRAEYMRPERIASIEAASEERFAHFSKAHSRLGFLETGFIDIMNRFRGRQNFLEKPEPDFNTIATSSGENSDSDLQEGEKPKAAPSIRFGQAVPNKIEISDSPETVDSIVLRYERYEAQRKSPEPVRWFYRVRDLLIIPLSVIVVWGGLTRGGLTHAITGLAVVRRDGRRAWIMQCAWRTLFFWLPFFAIAASIQILDAHGTEFIWWSQQLRRAFFLLPLAYLVLVFRWPSRGPHDIASGTFVVPK